MLHRGLAACLAIVASLAANLGAVAQTGVTPAAALENISNCALVGTDVFISTGQGAEQRRYKYPWDTAIDMLCNAKGFAIGSPPKSSNDTTRQAVPTPAPQPPAVPAPPAAARTASDFPSASAAISGENLRRAFADKAYTVRLADGSTWKLQYKANGYFFVNTSVGFNGSGTWKVQDDKVCTDGRGMTPACVVVHQQGDSLFMKRSVSGEIIELRPQ